MIWLLLRRDLRLCRAKFKVSLLCSISHCWLEGCGRCMNLVLLLRLHIRLESGLVVIMLRNLAHLGLLEQACLRTLLLEGLRTWVLMRALLFSMLSGYLLAKRRREVCGFEGLMLLLVKLVDRLWKGVWIGTRLEGTVGKGLLIRVQLLICFHLSAI